MTTEELLDARVRLHNEGKMADDWPDEAVEEVVRLREKIADLEGKMLLVRVETDVAAGTLCQAMKVEDDWEAYPIEMSG